MDEVRLTVGAARYTANFTPPTMEFPRGSPADPDWADVALLCGFNSGIFDDSSYARTLTAVNGAAAITPDDGEFNWQVIAKTTPQDDTFIEASLTAASGIMTQGALPTATKTVTVGTYGAGPTTAVYTWRASVSSAYDVLIGASVVASLSNLIAAINAGAGAGTLYGTGTLVNNDVFASALPAGQMMVTANAPGSAGNAITTTTNDTNASWDDATLTGGADIPGYSQFGLQRPPNETTLIDSITLVQRAFKTDSGTANTQASFVGPLGGVASGADRAITTVPTFYFDTIEEDPDTGDPLTPTSVVNGLVRINRTE
jgi:hypothetical protein